jgi:hypothetical protein
VSYNLKWLTYQSLVLFGPKITSDFEKRMVHRWIFGESDYKLTNEEFEDIVGSGQIDEFYSNGTARLNTYQVPKYDFAIGVATIYIRSLYSWFL